MKCVVTCCADSSGRDSESVSVLGDLHWARNMHFVWAYGRRPKSSHSVGRRQWARPGPSKNFVPLSKPKFFKVFRLRRGLADIYWSACPKFLLIFRGILQPVETWVFYQHFADYSLTFWRPLQVVAVDCRWTPLFYYLKVGHNRKNWRRHVTNQHGGYSTKQVNSLSSGVL